MHIQDIAEKAQPVNAKIIKMLSEAMAGLKPWETMAMDTHSVISMQWWGRVGEV